MKCSCVQQYNLKKKKGPHIQCNRKIYNYPKQENCLMCPLGIHYLRLILRDHCNHYDTQSLLGTENLDMLQLEN